MCIFILGLKVNHQWPLLVAANRDEAYDRPSAPPLPLSENPCILGGRDVRAGGTWLGLNAQGLMVALTNHYLGNAFMQPRLPTSRGQLCLTALRERSPAAAVDAVRNALKTAPYNPFNLIAVNVTEAICIMHTGDVTERVLLTAGWHLVANRRMNDPDDPRVQRARSLLPATLPPNTDDLRQLFAAICRDHGEKGVSGQPDCICQHREHSGTRSSSLLFADSAGQFNYHHAEGAPCQSSYERILIPWQQGEEKARGKR